MARTLFFCMVIRKSSEITNSKPIFSQYNIFYSYEYFLFQFAFWSLFNHHQKFQSNQEQCSLCCSSPCLHVLLCTQYGPLQYFVTYFRKLKVIGVLRTIFPDYIVSCDYGYTDSSSKEKEDLSFDVNFEEPIDLTINQFSVFKMEFQRNK